MISERLDKSERARFLAVQRLRPLDESAAEALDHALVMESNVTGAISVSYNGFRETERVDFELGELPAEWVDSASEESLADWLMDRIRHALHDGGRPM